MSKRVAIRHGVLVVAASAFMVVLSVYLYVQQLFAHSSASPKFASGGECVDDNAVQQGQRVNPNKMLFISCGGFLD